MAIEAQRRVVRDLERTAPGTPAVTAARAMLSRLCREHGQLDAAGTELIACCATLRRSAGEGHELLAPWLLELSAALLARRGDAERAASLLAAADRTRADDSNPRPHWDAREYDETRRLIAERLTPGDVGVAESHGGALGVDDALRAAIDAMTRSAGTSPATLVHR